MILMTFAIWNLRVFSKQSIIIRVDQNIYQKRLNFLKKNYKTLEFFSIGKYVNNNYNNIQCLVSSNHNAPALNLVIPLNETAHI